MSGRRTVVLLMVSVLLCDWCALPAAAETEVPALDSWPGIAEALEKAAAFLHARAEDDEDHWILPPTRHRRQIGTRDVEVRYRREEVEMPVWEYYTTEEYRNVPVSDVSGAPLVRQRVSVRKRRQTGTEMQERLIRDRDGSIVRTERRAEWGPGGSIEWFQYQLGHNAMAAYAMIRAGTSPTDPVIERMVEQYRELFRAYGIPDDTWDIVWLTCLFSVLPGEDNAHTARQLASRLMDGQLDEGDMAGLWGPVSINRKVLAHWFRERDALVPEYVRAQQRNNHDERFRLERRLESIAGEISKVSMHAHTGHRLQDRSRITDDAGSTTILQGPTEYIFNQATADIESTSLALFALEVAHRHQRLPSTTEPPVGGRFNRPVDTPRTFQTVLPAAVQAIARVQDRSGGWHDTNLHGPVREFDDITTLPGLPASRRPFEPLPSEMTFTSVARGYAGLVSVVDIVGSEPLQSYRANLHYGLLGVKHFTNRMLEVDFDQIVGGEVPPYDALFFARRTLPSETPEAAPGIEEAGTRLLLQSQRDDGSWRSARRSGINVRPTSVSARMQVLPDLFRQDLDQFDLTQAHVPIAEPKEDDPEERNRRNVINRRFHSPREVLATAYAMLFLAERLADEDAAEAPEG